MVKGAALRCVANKWRTACYHFATNFRISGGMKRDSEGLGRQKGPINRDFQEKRVTRTDKADDLFLDLLRRFFTQNRNVSEKPTAPNYAPTAFADEADARKLNLRKADFKAAMSRLFNADKVYVETDGRPSRPCVATRIKVSIAVCHSLASCSALGSFVM